MKMGEVYWIGDEKFFFHGKIEETSILRWQLDCIFFLLLLFTFFFYEWGGCWWCREQKDIFEVWYLEDLGKYLSTQRL